MIRKECWQLLSLVVNEKTYLHVMRLKYDLLVRLGGPRVGGTERAIPPYRPPGVGQRRRSS